MHILSLSLSLSLSLFLSLSLSPSLSLSLPPLLSLFLSLFLSLSLFRRKNGQEGFIPANYVKEIEPSKVKKVVKKKEMINVPVKVKKTRIERR